MREAVILVHGLWMKGLEMLPLASALGRAGYTVRFFRYPSRQPLEPSARRLREALQRLAQAPVHLVAHSLGGLLLCHLAAQGGLPANGRVLMLATPLAGSRAARAFARLRLGRRLLGPHAEKALSGGRPSWPAGRPLGLIAGTRGIGLGTLVAGGLPRPHDGTVCVDETLTPEVTRHLMVNHSHFGLLWARDVHERILQYLATGEFGG